MSIPDIYAENMNNKIFTCMNFTGKNTLAFKDKLCDVLHKNKAVVIITETKNFIDSINFYSSLLSPDEESICKKYKFKFLRDKYTIHRGLLRYFISLIISQSPTRINILTNSYGKPYLDLSYLGFNISHSENYALFSFCLNSELGIDIEEDNKNINILELSRLICSKREFADLAMLDNIQQRHAFFTLWTHKEAISKNLGMGMSLDFKHINLDNKNLLLHNLSTPFYYAALALRKN